MLVDTLRRRAMDEGDRPVYVWESSEAGDRRCWTFAELDRQARRIGATLQAAHPPGTRALLMYEPGLEYAAAFVGCLYAGVVPAPAYPPSPWMLGPNIARLQALAADARAHVALTTSSALPLIRAADLRVEVDGRQLTWECTDVAAIGVEDNWRPRSARGDE